MTGFAAQLDVDVVVEEEVGGAGFDGIVAAGVGLAAVGDRVVGDDGAGVVDEGEDGLLGDAFFESGLLGEALLLLDVVGDDGIDCEAASGEGEAGAKGGGHGDYHWGN